MTAANNESFKFELSGLRAARDSSRDKQLGEVASPSFGLFI
jgi:hypothetical protein